MEPGDRRLLDPRMMTRLLTMTQGAPVQIPRALTCFFPLKAAREASRTMEWVTAERA